MCIRHGENQIRFMFFFCVRHGVGMSLRLEEHTLFGGHMSRRVSPTLFNPLNRRAWNTSRITSITDRWKHHAVQCWSVPMVKPWPLAQHRVSTKGIVYRRRFVSRFSFLEYLARNRSPRFRLTKRRHWQMEMHILRCLLRVKSSDGS